MLVFARRKGEAINIGDGILLQVVEVKTGRVWLGIQAPDHVTVDRAEVFERKRKQTTLKPSRIVQESPYARGE